MKLIFGADKMHSGEIAVFGKPVLIGSPIDAIRSGIMLCTEDRKALASSPSTRCRRTSTSVPAVTTRGGFWINQQWEDENARLRIRDMRVKTPSPQQAIMNLSGGNQQKAILGRWLSEDMKVILLDEPTRGIDVGAKNEIYNVIYDLAKVGIAVVVVSASCRKCWASRTGSWSCGRGRSPASFPTTRPTRSRRSIWPCRPVDLLTATR